MTWRAFLLFIALVLGTISAFAQSAGPVKMPPAPAANHPPVADPAPSSPAVTTPPSTPVAEPVPTDDGGDIRDIRGPISIPYPFLWALYVLGGLLLLAVLYALWRMYRKAAIARAKLPHEIALEKLEEARVLMEDNMPREYAFAVSEIIRKYIEQRFGEKAARRTTEEFLSDLLKQTGTPLAEHRALLEDFLMHCDLPKFARWQLSVLEMESMQESARNFILNTQPNAPKHVAAPEPAPTR